MQKIDILIYSTSTFDPMATGLLYMVADVLFSYTISVALFK